MSTEPSYYRVLPSDVHVVGRVINSYRGYSTLLAAHAVAERVALDRQNERVVVQVSIGKDQSTWDVTVWKVGP